MAQHSHGDGSQAQHFTADGADGGIGNVVHQPGGGADQTVAADFRSGYAKNLFTVRARKTDYVISKTLACFVGGALMILAFFIGTMLGGAISGLSFELGAAGISSLIMCMISKILLIGAVVPLYLLWSVIAKQKLWLSLMGSFMTGMFLFMMIPMLTPLDSTITGRYPPLWLAVATLAAASSSVQLLFYRMMKPRPVKALPVLACIAYLFWQGFRINPEFASCLLSCAAVYFLCILKKRERQ